MGGERVELVVDGITHGAEAVGRLPSGKACFVGYAVPGERVLVEVVEEHPRWCRARLVAVLEPSPDRVSPPCPYFGQGRCGGCALQHVAPDRQARLKRRVVVEQLARIGGIAEPPVSDTVRVRDFGYRNHARFAVDPDGRLGFRRAGSHDVLPVDRCPLLHPEAQAVRDEAGDGWDGVEEVGVRAALAGTGSALVVTPGPQALPPLPEGDTPVALRDTTGRAHPLRGDPTVVERVAGFSYRVSAGSFFQSNTAGAAALVELVREGADVGPGDAVADLYAGVGLFSRPLAADGATVVAVEGSEEACTDARANLAATTASVVCEPVEEVLTRWTAEIRATTSGRRFAGFDVVVLDPPRRGAGRDVCGRIATLRPRTVVYVSCDPAALARDARTLVAAGYRLARAVPVDQFAQTAAIETVATFARH
ncbi:MAG TPA: class I SAM-dependent RNA methyltransferase [Egibacteraceae bacterium]|jgi:23S rRNA (uracil1939-C5)-methyltransferase|nr:class I SAM-dependent RNA methyltransferase [Egibacteraceae bacterium]